MEVEDTTLSDDLYQVHNDGSSGQNAIILPSSCLYNKNKYSTGCRQCHGNVPSRKGMNSLNSVWSTKHSLSLSSVLFRLCTWSWILMKWYRAKLERSVHSHSICHSCMLAILSLWKCSTATMIASDRWQVSWLSCQTHWQLTWRWCLHQATLIMDPEKKLAATPLWNTFTIHACAFWFQLSTRARQ